MKTPRGINHSVQSDEQKLDDSFSIFSSLLLPALPNLHFYSTSLLSLLLSFVPSTCASFSLCSFFPSVLLLFVFFPHLYTYYSFSCAFLFSVFGSKSLVSTFHSVVLHSLWIIFFSCVFPFSLSSSFFL